MAVRAVTTALSSPKQGFASNAEKSSFGLFVFQFFVTELYVRAKQNVYDTPLVTSLLTMLASNKRGNTSQLFSR